MIDNITQILSLLEVIINQKNFNFKKNSEKKMAIFIRLSEIKKFLGKRLADNATAGGTDYPYIVSQENILKISPKKSESVVDYSYKNNTFDKIVSKITDLEEKITKKLVSFPLTILEFQKWIKECQYGTMLYFYQLTQKNYTDLTAEYLWEMLAQYNDKSKNTSLLISTFKSPWIWNEHNENLIIKNYSIMKDFLLEAKRRIDNKEINVLKIDILLSPIDNFIPTDFQGITSSVIVFIGGLLAKDHDFKKASEKIKSKSNLKGIQLIRYKFGTEEIITILKKILLIGKIDDRTEPVFPIGNIKFHLEKRQDNSFILDNKKFLSQSPIYSYLDSVFFKSSEKEYYTNIETMLQKQSSLISKEREFQIVINPDIPKIERASWLMDDLISCSVYIPPNYQNKVRPLTNVILILNEIMDLTEEETLEPIVSQITVEDSKEYFFKLSKNLKSKTIEIIFVCNNELLSKTTVRKETISYKEKITLLFQLVNDQLGLNYTKEMVEKNIGLIFQNYHYRNIKNAIEEYFEEPSFTRYRERRTAISEITNSIDSLITSLGYIGRTLGPKISNFVEKNMTDLKGQWTRLINTGMTSTENFEKKWNDLIDLEIYSSPCKDELIRFQNDNKIDPRISALAITLLVRNFSHHKTIESSIYLYSSDFKKIIETLVYSIFIIINLNK